MKMNGPFFSLSLGNVVPGNLGGVSSKKTSCKLRGNPWMPFRVDGHVTNNFHDRSELLL